MSGTARPWRGAGLLLLGGALLSGARVFGADEPPMSNQLCGPGPAGARPGCEPHGRDLLQEIARARSGEQCRVGRAEGPQAGRPGSAGGDARAEGSESWPGEARRAGDRHASAASAGRHQGHPGADPGGREYHPAGADRQRRAADQERAGADESEPARGGDERLAVGPERDPLGDRRSPKTSAPSSNGASRPS